MALPNTQPQGITPGPDGNIWFTEEGLNQLGSINPYSHVISNYPYEPPGYTNNDQAKGITGGPNNTIGFVETQNNLVMEFNMTTQTFVGYGPVFPPPPAQLWSIGQGPGVNIYYSEPAFKGVGNIAQLYICYYNNSGYTTSICTKLNVGTRRV